MLLKFLYIEIISKQYSGTVTVANQADIGINIPSIYNNSIGISIRHNSKIGGGATILPKTNDEFLLAGGFRSKSDSSNSGFTPSQLFSIDKKTDDGKPMSGKIMGVGGANASFPCNTTTKYSNLDKEQAACVLVDFSSF